MSEYNQARYDAYHNGDFDAIERIIDAEATGEPLTSKQTVISRKGMLHHIDPGAGAIAYVLEYVASLARENAMPVVRRLLTETSGDKRVKRCGYCGYPWRDGSLRNTKRTCSDECTTGIKTIQRSQQRADKALLSGKVPKLTKQELNYYWWFEYPFWLNDYENLKLSWKHEVPSDVLTLDFISAQNQTLGLGNRKRQHATGQMIS